ncbi:uncharacterized oxidoreductase SERP2049 isoform X1 [Stomoxys calcitrans]|uniref:uncharacterized oxidoreductase SERP2049 isoform X1 n=1 Tax=Stomoxys calcitrans TaxID=35570 RepID=UPI0027E297D3|nr:uncharacterized oxidoreductase SERP2049 isoform X1 [Stomoxys calcitrans]
MLVAYCQAMHTQVLKIEALSSLYVIGIILGYPIIITVSLVAHIFQLLVKFVKSRFGHSKSIAGEVALVTGAGHGLGRDIAIALAQQGCHIAVVGTQVKYLLETSAFIAQTFGVKTKAYKVDVTNYQQICELKENVSKDLGDVTILINNAGVIYMSTKEKPSAEVVQRMINVNLTGTTLVTDVFLPKMKELNRGHIVNVSSASVFFPLPIHYIYGSTKAAMRYLTAALRVHLRQIKSNVKATCLMPSYLTTNKGVSEDMKATGITPGQFQIDGDVLAQYVIKALHWGHEEIAVPCGFLWVQKLSAIFPAYIQEFSLTLLSRTLKK